MTKFPFEILLGGTNVYIRRQQHVKKQQQKI